MTAALVKYEAARAALAEAHRIDEVKTIRDKAQAMAAYARQARDTQMVQWATEIKVRAERRCGEMLHDSAENGQRATKGRPEKTSHGATFSTLHDLGLTRDQSSRYQKLAAMPAEHFETAIETAKATAGEVTSAHMLRIAEELRATRDVREMLKRTSTDTGNTVWLPILSALQLLHRRTSGLAAVPPCPRMARDELAAMWPDVQTFFRINLE